MRRLCKFCMTVMRPPRNQNPNRASNRNIGDLSTRLENMHSLVEDTLAHLDPADAEGLAVLRQHFDTKRRDFEAHRLEAEAARQRMREHTNRKTDRLTDDGELATAESQDYAQDAILAAVIALEEAELATLEAILNKVEAQQSHSTE